MSGTLPGALVQGVRGDVRRAPVAALAMGVTSGDCWLPGAQGPKDRQGQLVWAWAFPLASELEAWRALRAEHRLHERLEVVGGRGREHPEAWHCANWGGVRWLQEGTVGAKVRLCDREE